MIRITELPLPLDYTPEALRQAILQRLAIPAAELLDFTLFKRSYDARKKNSGILFICIVDVTVRDEAAVLKRLARDRQIGISPDTSYHPVAQARAQLEERPLVVGFGPCGLFAALLLAQMGFRPIVLERGRDVRRRTRDTWALWRQNTLTPESNVQFGEGGAGLFSDGKLYSQIKDPKFYGRKVMREFVRAGAPAEILYVSKPHIGTFRLTGVVSKMREEIISLGGEVRFESKVTDLLIERGQIEGVVLASGETLHSRHVVLALGHSSRDTFRMLEHRRRPSRGQTLRHRPAYRASAVADRRRPARALCRSPATGCRRLQAGASRPQWALGLQLLHVSRRHGGCRHFRAGARGHQRHESVLPQRAQCQRRHRGRDQSRSRTSPADRSRASSSRRRGNPRPISWAAATTARRRSWSAISCAASPPRRLGEIVPSYTPGVRLGDLSQALPDYAIDAIREALPAFGKQIRGFDRDDAVLTAVESRTSSPVRITRDAESLQSLNVRGLYPCGEGAGYAGGILSAGVDGIKVAEAVARSLS